MKRLLITTLSLSLLAPTVHAMDSDNFGNEELPNLSLKIGTFFNNSPCLFIVGHSNQQTTRFVRVRSKEKASIDWTNFPLPLGQLTTSEQVNEREESIRICSESGFFSSESDKKLSLRCKDHGSISCAFDCARIKNSDAGASHLYVYACLHALRCKVLPDETFEVTTKSKVWHKHKIEVPPKVTQADIEFAFELGEKNGGVQSTVVFTDAKGARSAREHVTPLTEEFLKHVYWHMTAASPRVNRKQKTKETT